MHERVDPRCGRRSVVLSRSNVTFPRSDEVSGLELDGLIVDLDGVVWLGAEEISGSVEAIRALDARGIRVVFLTNDPRSSRHAHARRLTALGIDTTEETIVTSASALASFLTQHEDLGARIYAIGSADFKAELESAGLNDIHGDAGRDADIVAVAGHDGFDYSELRIATQALRRGARLYAAGRDAIFPMPEGPWPGTGAIVAAVEVAGGRSAISVGKPEPYIFELASSLLIGCGHVAIVGDNLLSDILGGRRAGLTTILVLTGSSQRDEIPGASAAPDVVVERLADVAHAIVRSTGA
jgi:glycerol-1-phosphatase